MDFSLTAVEVPDKGILPNLTVLGLFKAFTAFTQTPGESSKRRNTSRRISVRLGAVKMGSRKW